MKFDRLNLLRAGARELRFQRNPTNNQWRVVAPTPPRRANAAQIEELLATLMRWPVQEFVSDRPDADLEPYGLAKPETEVAFGVGTNDALVVQFGRSPTNQPGLVYARNLTTTNVVLVSAELLAQLRAPVWDFSEHRLLDPLSAGQFDLIEVRGRETFTLRRQTNATNNAGWVADNPARTPADPQLMQSFLLNLETLEARELEKEVVTDYSPMVSPRPRVPSSCSKASPIRRVQRRTGSWPGWTLAWSPTFRPTACLPGGTTRAPCMSCPGATWRTSPGPCGRCRTAQCGTSPPTRSLR